MKRTIVVILLILSGICFGGRGSEPDLYKDLPKKANALIVYPSDNLQAKLDELEANTRMGTLSATNLRVLYLMPGSYNQTPWIIDVNYVDIIGMSNNPQDVRITSDLTYSCNDAVLANFTVIPSSGRAYYCGPTTIPTEFTNSIWLSSLESGQTFIRKGGPTMEYIVTLPENAPTNTYYWIVDANKTFRADVMIKPVGDAIYKSDGNVLLANQAICSVSNYLGSRGLIYKCESGYWCWDTTVQANWTNIDIFVEDFNDYNDGTIDQQDSWQNSMQNFIVQNNVSYDGGKAIEVNGITASERAEKSCEYRWHGSQSVYMRRDNSAGSVSTRQSLVIYDGDFDNPAHNIIAEIYIAKTNIKYDSNGSGVILKTSYSFGTWYKLQCEWREKPTRAVRYQVDSEGWTNWVPRAEAASTRYSLEVALETFNLSGGGIAYFDLIE